MIHINDIVNMIALYWASMCKIIHVVCAMLCFVVIWKYSNLFKSFWITSLAVARSPNRNNFRVTGSLWGESTGHRWNPLTKANDAELLYIV